MTCHSLFISIMKKLNLFILFSFCFSIIIRGQVDFAAIDSLIKKELPQGSEVGMI